MESVFEAFISNPALYSAGHLVGETLHFPSNTEEVQSLLKRIGVDGVRCQEYFIISFDSDILGLYDYLGEYENIDELNHLAHLLKELSPSERETLEAVMDIGQHCGSVQDLINLTGVMFLMLAVMLPAFLLAMYEKDGLPAEKVLKTSYRPGSYGPESGPIRHKTFTPPLPDGAL